MNYKNAPGRNWARQPRRRGTTLQPDALPRASFEAWHSGSDRGRAAGRNWVRESRKPRRVHLEGSAASTSAAQAYPRRERGGGDHDEPYAYHAPSVDCPLPFTLRQYARLLMLKSKLAADGLLGSC